MSVPAEPCPARGDPLRAAAAEAVEIAAVAYLEDSDLRVLRHVLRLAYRHGLSIEELSAASGLDEPYLAELLKGAR